MSNYENQGCSNCIKSQAYSPLDKTADYSCDYQCSCRYTNERSDKDKLYFNFYVLGKPMNLVTENYKKNIPTNKEK